MNYDYRMGPSQDGYNNPNIGHAGSIQSPQQQQQWNGPPHPQMQSGPPQSGPHSYQMSQGSNMRGPSDQSGWQNPNMYQEMGGHSALNGDNRMSGGFNNQMQLNMVRSFIYAFVSFYSIC
jgi:hypothetical protein